MSTENYSSLKWSKPSNIIKSESIFGNQTTKCEMTRSMATSIYYDFKITLFAMANAFFIMGHKSVSCKRSFKKFTIWCIDYANKLIYILIYYAKSIPFSRNVAVKNML